MFAIIEFETDLLPIGNRYRSTGPDNIIISLILTDFEGCRKKHKTTRSKIIDFKTEIESSTVICHMSDFIRFVLNEYGVYPSKYIELSSQEGRSLQDIFADYDIPYYPTDICESIYLLCKNNISVINALQRQIIVESQTSDAVLRN